MKDRKPCLVVIDMINGFIFEGALSDSSIDKISGNVLALVKDFVERDYPIISFRDSHQKNSKEFNAFPPHCLENTNESELIESLKPYENHMITLLKNSTNGFMQPQFMDTFNQLDRDEYICVGCCTDICVLQFALSLQGYINEHNLETRVSVVQDSVETFNLPSHSQNEYNRAAMNILRGAGIRVVASYKEIQDEL
ncbi:cysteine hydrolase family protein [Anaerorhabdus sp.]|uniref:cysteine hydrolase family protein n=1 Tax=Anaerorhabdus sp. TaxID=1872524 RepID=UPI002FC8A86F